jgi:hypothetical protein
MWLRNQTVCRRCGRGMQTVATISPIGGKPGLVAFLCPACGSATSDLIDPAHEQVSHGYNAERRRASDHAEH